jgi:hypothetical protein
VGRREKLLGQLAEHLAEDEEILDAMVGAYHYLFRPNPERGIFAATNRRLVFFASRRKEYDFESFPYGKISSLEHDKKLSGGTLKFRLPHATRTTTLMPSFTTVTATMIQPVTDLPAFVELLERQMREPSPMATEQPASLSELSESESVASEGFIMRRTSERRFLMQFYTGWEMRRRAGSHKSVRYRTLTRRRQQGGYEVTNGGSETCTLSTDDLLFCEMTDVSGRRIATCEWGEFTKLGESRMELSTNIIFPDGPNFDLRIDGEKSYGSWSWSEDLRFKGTLVADGSAGGFMNIYHPTPTAALLLWWAVHRRKTIPYLPPPPGVSY